MTLPRITPWRNQYIDALATLPDYILVCKNEGVPSLEEQKKLEEKIGLYKNLAVEFGTGSGSHIIDRALVDKDTLYVGFELRFKRAYSVAEKANELGIKNILMLRTKAEKAVKIFKKESITKFYMNFPDPWEKRREQKNRMIQDKTCNEWHTLLKSEGSFLFKTDHPGYFKHALITFPKNHFEITKQTEDLYASEHISENIATEFERLFCSKGFKINFLEAIKSSS